jgi:hypothetical protein
MSDDTDFLDVNGFRIVDWSDVDTDDDDVELEKPSHRHPPYKKPDGDSYVRPSDEETEEIVKNRLEEIDITVEVGGPMAAEKEDGGLYEPEPPFVCAVCKQMIDPDGDMVIDGSRKEVRHDGCDKLK